MFTLAYYPSGEVQHPSSTLFCMVTLWQESLSSRSTLTGKRKHKLSELCLFFVYNKYSKINVGIPGLMWAPFSTRSSTKSLRTVLQKSLELSWPLRERIWWVIVVEADYLIVLQNVWTHSTLLLLYLDCSWLIHWLHCLKDWHISRCKDIQVHHLVCICNMHTAPKLYQDTTLQFFF